MSFKYQCETGCKVFSGGETKHHPDCIFYPESLSKKYDEMEKQLAEANEIICNPDLTYQNSKTVRKYQMKYF